MYIEGTHTHIGFADESHYNKGRFRSLAVVSLKQGGHESVKKQVCTLLEESDVKELKWEKVKDAKYRFAARKILCLAVDLASRGVIRIDTLIWDIEDTRHKIKGRDDLENLHRMYHHLFKDVLQKRWGDGAIWILYPDENRGLNFKDIHYFLHLKQGKLTPAKRSLFSKKRSSLEWIQYYHIADISPVKSHDEPLVQISDLFAGMAAFSYKCFDKFKRWEKANSPQRGLFDVHAIAENGDGISNSERERFFLLDGFNKECKRRKMSVSLNSHHGLRTMDPRYPLNFWFYLPQSEMDNAPVRTRR